MTSTALRAGSLNGASGTCSGREVRDQRNRPHGKIPPAPFAGLHHGPHSQNHTAAVELCTSHPGPDGTKSRAINPPVRNRHRPGMNTTSHHHLRQTNKEGRANDPPPPPPP